ncbi:TPA: 1-deoxy-D-xylulose-5-phosphate synthase, partial [Candidatus Peregrinibacteria bacterium]|nr:1-deoxy-D-xylulose-5-phosphate synthase [Candidatus Peregrinibacteria bacterium]
LSTGTLCYTAIESLKNPEISQYGLYDMRQIKPLPENFLDTIFTAYQKIITLEEGVISGGFGSRVLQYANSQKFSGEIVIKGIPEKFIPHATREEQLEECGLDVKNILS